MKESEIWKIISEAQDKYYEGFKEIRRETEKQIGEVEARLTGRFDDAHKQNTQSLDRITVLLEKMNGRVGALEKWKTGITYIWIAIMTAWAALLGVLGLKK